MCISHLQAIPMERELGKYLWLFIQSGEEKSITLPRAEREQVIQQTRSELLNLSRVPISVPGVDSGLMEFTALTVYRESNTRWLTHSQAAPSQLDRCVTEKNAVHIISRLEHENFIHKVFLFLTFFLL